MEEKLAKVHDKAKLITSRRDTESHAFQADVGLLKKKVRAYERHIKNLKELVDQEKTNDIMELIHEDHRVTTEEGGEVDLQTLI